MSVALSCVCGGGEVDDGKSRWDRGFLFHVSAHGGHPKAR